MSSVSYKIYLFSVETGLEGLLFTMLNSETDAKMLSNIHDTLISMLHELVMENLAGWLTLCKAVLSASTGTIPFVPPPPPPPPKKKKKKKKLPSNFQHQ